MAQDFHRIPDGARGIGVGRELLIHDAQDYALAVSPGTLALAHAGGGATNCCNLFGAKIEDLGDGEVDIILVFCAQGGGSAEDDELLVFISPFPSYNIFVTIIVVDLVQAARELTQSSRGIFRTSLLKQPPTRPIMCGKRPGECARRRKMLRRKGKTLIFSAMAGGAVAASTYGTRQVWRKGSE